MIVNRRTFVVKRGRMQDVVELLREGGPDFPHPHPRRFYTPRIAPFDVLAIEIEFENLKDYEEYWTKWGTRPETAEFMDKWFELTQNGGTNEIWTVEVE